MALHEKKKRLGELLVEAGALTQEQIEQALIVQKTTKQRLGDVLVNDGFITEAQMIDVLSQQLNIEVFDLDKEKVDPSIANLITEDLARMHTIIPAYRTGDNTLALVMSDPLSLIAIDDVRFYTGLEVQPLLCSKSKIVHAIDVYYGKQYSQKVAEELHREMAAELAEEDASTVVVEESESDAPTVRLVSSIISQAAVSGASDIHIEPFEKIVRVRFRVDGELIETLQSPISVHPAIVSRIKIIGGMDIAEHRIPQDGRAETKIKGRPVDLRISSIPTIYGEKIVIRLLDQSNIMLSKEQLGFSPQQFEIFESILRNPNGIFVVTGPTGSGKSTTLYTTLAATNTPTKNIVTVEDPVEYKLDGINQVHINAKAGMTFASALRAILRQDPDIIMLGEIRDGETADIAVKAAITGHFVLSTLHTNDAASTIARLVDMGIEPYALSSALVGVLAQRLVRRICKNCKEERKPTEQECHFLGLEYGSKEAEEMIVCSGKGCATCNNTGYKGRAAIHEILPIYGHLKTLITKGASSDELAKYAREEMGMQTLWDDCLRLVKAGVTTVDEMVKVAFSLDG